MRRILVLAVLFVSCLYGTLFAAKANIYQITTSVDASGTTSRVVTFPYTIRDLIVRNDDATEPVWLSLNRSSTENWSPAIGTAGSIWIPAGSEVNFYDLMLDYVAVSRVTAAVSRVTIIASY